MSPKKANKLNSVHWNQRRTTTTSLKIEEIASTKRRIVQEPKVMILFGQYKVQLDRTTMIVLIRSLLVQILEIIISKSKTR